jgi:selenocysteine-specific elongation factor
MCGGACNIDFAMASSRVTHAIIGTAGHIDHGKTALIKALTGQDTDRLKEEKERGISIDLGFAYFTLPDGIRAGIVDVPGHERFIRNMLAGAHGIDLVLFTVAADDGVMPQTEEHLDILHLLGTRRGIFVITKADLADAARLREVRDEIGLLADGTTLAGAPIIEVSSITGRGLEQLRGEMARQLDGFQARRATGIFRLPLDRAFTIKGHGIVVTGTAMGADVRVGDRLRVLPAGGEVRVRSVQVHSDSVESAGLCQRVALNLTGAEKLELKRGAVLADERLESASGRFDAWLEIRPGAKRALKNNTRVRLFIGTAETIARAIVLDEEGGHGGPPHSIAPKAAGLAQLVTDTPVVALAGDRFVIRDETNSRTLGGGVVLNPTGRRVRKPVEDYRSNLRVLKDSPSSGGDAIEALINLQESFAMGATKIATLMNIPTAEAEAALKQAARFVKLSVGDEEAFTTKSRWEALKHFALDAVRAYHRAEPLSPGMEMEALRTRLPFEIGARAFRPIVDRLSAESEIVREESVVRVRSHRVQLGGEAETLGAQIEAALNGAQFQPPDLKQLAEALKIPGSQMQRVRTVLLAMEREGRVVKIATDLYFSRAAADGARAKLVEYLKTHHEITAATFRDLLGASRKFAIALLDHFDHSGVTTRVGDARRLRGA